MLHAETIDIEKHIEALADELVTTRDFCGDEKQCARDYVAEHAARWPLPSRIRLTTYAQARADELWRESQRAAGVKRPIQPGERQSIERALGGDS